MTIKIVKAYLHLSKKMQKINKRQKDEINRESLHKMC